MREADGKPLNEKPKQRRSGRIHRVMDAAIISRTIDARTIIHVYQIIMQLADVTKQQCPPGAFDSTAAPLALGWLHHDR
jgi:hypothetical protein